MTKVEFLALNGQNQRAAVIDALATLLAAGWTPSMFAEAYERHQQSEQR